MTRGRFSCHTGREWECTYDANGMRTKRTNSIEGEYTYVYNGDLLSSMTVNNHIFYFTYDATGTPLTVTLDGTTYYYVTNIQGDIIAILDTSGNTVVAYTYTAWGDPYTTVGEYTVLGRYNPLLYRGYVYDSEMYMYYVSSRYYDPGLGRWISADAFVSTGQGFTGNNMFAYCGNNPVIRCDVEGDRYCAATSVSDESSYDRSYACYWQGQVVLEKYNPDPIGSYSGGNVYLVKNPSDVITNFPGDVIVRDVRGPGDGHGVEIQYSFVITDKKQMTEILNLLYTYEAMNPTGWNRTIESMMVEWDAHNDAHAFFTLTHLNEFTKRAAHVYFNNGEEGWTYWDHTFGRFLKGK